MAEKKAEEKKQQQAADHGEAVTRRASDMLSKRYDVAEVKKVEDILDQDNTLLEVQFPEGKFGEYASIHARTGVDGKGKEFAVNCGSKVVCQQLKEILKNGNPPFVFRIKEVKNYYVIE